MNAQLITYPDSLGGDLRTLNDLLLAHFRDVFGGVHILPPFPSSGDRGFAPLTYREIEPTFGTWADVTAISRHFAVLVDLMVNHVSRQSAEFQDFLRRGRRSPYADLFITLDKIWPGGEPRAEDVAKIFLRRPQPFSTVMIKETGEPERIWTTFGRTEPSEQIDLDVNSPLTRQFLADLLAFLASQGVKIVRLDAVGYVIKKPGTSCFMVEPEVYEFMDWLERVAEPLGLTLLPEVHDHYTVQRALSAHGYRVYDFVLPLLILHTFISRSGGKLAAYLKTCPPQQFTMLDCHDGIPVQPDLVGVLTEAEMAAAVEHCLGRGANISPLMKAGHVAEGFNAHQINITYYDALGCDDEAYLAARALQFFAPGVPQVYYVGLLAGENDDAAVVAQRDGRAVNRHNYTVAEVEDALRKPVVRRLRDLIRFRNTHPAFGGELHVLDSGDTELRLEWRNGDAVARLNVDLAGPRWEVTG